MDQQTITLLPVNSSMVKAIGYNSDKEWLYVQFNNGIVYKYPAVSAVKAIGVLTADSIGRAIRQTVIDQKLYTFTKLKVGENIEVRYASTFQNSLANAASASSNSI